MKFSCLFKKTALVMAISLHSLSPGAAQIEQDISLDSTPGGDVYLNVVIQGLKGRMILDTASTSSVLDSKYLANLTNYIQLNSEKGFGIGSKEATLISKKIQLPDIEIAGQKLTKVNINTHNLEHISDGFLGLAGFDLIRLLSEGLYFSESKTLLLAKQTNTESSNSLSLFYSDIGLPYIVINMNEQAVGLIIDTGSQHSVINQRDAIGLSIKSEPIPNAYTYDINGNQVPIQITSTLPVLKEDKTLFESRFIVTDLESILANTTFQHRVIGVIGLKQLKTLNTVIGFTTNTVTFSG